MIVCTIGFSKKDLREFIRRLKNAGVKKVIDIRLNNTSQLAGYAKKQDLEFILELVGIGYEHCLAFAPDDALMNEYKEKKISRTEFERRFEQLLEERNALAGFDLQNEPDIVCLLCSEDKPTDCHRLLVAEKMQKYYDGVVINHL